jgi:hypothetical protein
MDEWPSKLRLISVLATTHVFLSRSTEEGWPDENPQKTALEISQVIAHLFEPSIPLPEYCSILFAPTGPIQEIAMANKWHDSYLMLSSEFDRLAYLVKSRAS